MKSDDDQEDGVPINWKKLNNLRYTNDTLIIVDDEVSQLSQQ